MEYKRLLASALATSLAAGATQAAVSFSDARDFEGGTDGQPFNTTAWNINSPSAVVEADGSAQSPFNNSGETVHTHTKGIILTNSSATDAPATGADFNADPDVNTTHYFQFDYKTLGDADNAGLFIQGNAGRAINIHMSSTGGNAVQVNQGSGFGSIGGMSLTPDTWYRFTLTINPLSAADDSFDLRVQSLESFDLDVTAAGLGFQNDASDLNSFRFHFNVGASSGSGDQYAIDNTRWTTNPDDLVFAAIPEPGSLLLLSLGGVCMLYRRR